MYMAQVISSIHYSLKAAYLKTAPRDFLMLTGAGYSKKQVGIGVIWKRCKSPRALNAIIKRFRSVLIESCFRKQVHDTLHLSKATE